MGVWRKPQNIFNKGPLNLHEHAFWKKKNRWLKRLDFCRLPTMLNPKVPVVGRLVSPVSFPTSLEKLSSELCVYCLAHLLHILVQQEYLPVLRKLQDTKNMSMLFTMTNNKRVKKRVAKDKSCIRHRCSHSKNIKQLPILALFLYLQEEVFQEFIHPNLSKLLTLVLNTCVMVLMTSVSFVGWKSKQLITGQRRKYEFKTLLLQCRCSFSEGWFQLRWIDATE